MKKEVQDELIVVKRSGQRVAFNSTKIAVAIKHAFDSVLFNNQEKEINKVYEAVLTYINETYIGRKTINVEDIQDVIETKLKQNRYEDVYQAFSEYRLRRAASRKAFNIKQQHKFVKAIERIANETNEIKNTKFKPNQILLDFGKTVSCEFTKSYILDNKFVRAHEEGTIYIHNLDYFNLGSLSSTHLIFDSALANNTFPLNVLSLAINAKNEIDGEISIAKMDYILVPYLLRKYKQILKQNVNNYFKVIGVKEYINIKKIEELIERETTLNLDIKSFNNYLLNEQTIKIFLEAYDNSIERLTKELATSINELLNSLNNNLAENKKYSISLGTNQSYEGILINHLYLEELNKLKRLENVTTIIKINNNNDIVIKASELITQNKNIALSFINTSYNKDKFNEVEYFSNGKRIFENNIFEEKESIGRMIVASTSINMSRLGFKYQNKIKHLYMELDEILELVKNELLMVFETIGNKVKENYEVVFNSNILDDEKLEHDQKIRKVLKNGVLNIELAGLKECVLNIESDEIKQKELVMSILKYVNTKVHKFTEETKLNFVVSETSKQRPLKELITLDKSIYGITKNITDKNLYSRIDSLFQFKELETDLKYLSNYQKLLTGGCFTKMMLPKNSSSKNIINIINTLEKSDLGFIKICLKGDETS